MKKEFVLFALLLLLIGCVPHTIQGDVDALKANEDMFEDTLADFVLDPFYDFDFHLSKTEIESSKEELATLQDNLVLLQNLSMTQRQLFESLQQSSPSKETGEYLDTYTHALDLYDGAFARYPEGLENVNVALDYAALDAEYADLDEKVSASWDDFAYYANLRQYENASKEVDTVLVDLDRQVAILDEQHALIPFAFNEKYKEYTLLFVEYFQAVDAELANDDVTVYKINAAGDDYIDKINLYDLPSTSDVDEEDDEWYKEHVYNSLHAADENLQDAEKERGDAEDLLKNDLDNDFHFRGRTYRAPESPAQD